MTPLREQLQHTLGAAYTLAHELGGGGMSRVFVATETALGRSVVVKVLPPELVAGVNVDRFNREILLAAQLQHPHIVPVLTAGEIDGLPFYTMPFVEGESLRQRLIEQQGLPITEIVGILRDVAKALAYAHERGIVHRDIKPDNVLLTGGSATVTDFGIAKAISASRTNGAHETLTQVGTSIGTPAYMSPEQAAADPDTDHRTDIYAFGCVAYELLSGRPPFADRTPRQLFVAHMGEAPRPLEEFRTDIPAELSGLVMRCLAKEPDSRPQRATDLLHVLEAVTTGATVSTPPMPFAGAGSARRALATYAVSFVVVAILAKAAIVGVGLPDWVFPGSLIVMALGLPAIAWTAYVHRIAKRAITATPTFTPGGTPRVTHGTMATFAMKASPHTSWRTTARAGAIAMGIFVLLVGAFMAMRALGIGPFGSLLASGKLAAKEPILLADFAVVNGDSALGRVVSDAVRAGLNESSVIALVLPAEIGASLQRMKLPPTSRLDAALARVMAQRDGIKAIADGEVTQLGPSYVVAVRLVTADSGKELVSYRASANDAQGLIQASDELARKLRAKAGESLRQVQSAAPLERVTTSSLDALRKYSEGSRANDVRDFAKAEQALREAVAIDPSFGAAWRKLGAALANLGRPRAAVDSAAQHAYALRDRMTESERDLAIAEYYRNGPGHSRVKTIEAYERMLAHGDSSVSSLSNLALEVRSRRQFARAETLLIAAFRRSPSNQNVSGNIVDTYVGAGDFRRADSVLAVLLPQSPALRSRAIEESWFHGDVDAVAKSTDSALTGPPEASRPPWAAFRRADVARVRGRLDEWRARSEQGYFLDSTAGRRPSRAAQAANRLHDAFADGRPDENDLHALDAALAASPLDRIPAIDRPDYSIAMAYAEAGRPDKARAILAQYEKQVTDTTLKQSLAPDLHAALAAIAAAEHRWGDAIDQRRKSDSLPDGPVTRCTYCLPLGLFRTFADAGMTDSALAQYEIYKTSPWGKRELRGPDLLLGPVGYERLAKIYDVKGDAQKANENYRIFIELWKNADPALQPRVAEARRRRDALTKLAGPPRR